MRVLEVNNIDLIGRRFNGYDFVEELNTEEMHIDQSTIIKQSLHPNVYPLLGQELMPYFYQLEKFETEHLAVHSNLSITSPALINSPLMKQADIVHFHMFHNSKFSLYSLLEIASKKKVILSLHDPWLLTGHCVHFHNCDGWKNGCKHCPHLDWIFALKEDYASELFQLKKKIFSQIDVDLVVPSHWMLDLVKKSPILKHIKNVHLIPFGIDTDIFSDSIGKEKARKHFGIDPDDFVLFFRSQKEFKGTEYIYKSLKGLKTNRRITILTCSEKGLLKGMEDQYRIIDLGIVDTDTLVYCYNACDLFLMPSIGESFGMMAIEAMSCKRPVIVFDNTALPYVTHAPECGYLVKNKDYKDLRKAILHFLEDEEDCQIRGELGRNIVLKTYRLSDYYANIQNLYREVYRREHKKISFKQEKEEESINYLKYKLNQLSKELFANDQKKYHLLEYKIDSTKKCEGKIKFSSLAIQKIIDDYNKKLYSLLLDQPKSIKIVSKLKEKIRSHPRVYALLKKIRRSR